MQAESLLIFESCYTYYLGDATDFICLQKVRPRPTPAKNLSESEYGLQLNLNFHSLLQLLFFELFTLVFALFTPMG